MDIERIELARIPDMAPVYGGVRGRTMSSRHLAYAWKALVEAGVRTVIDLREKDYSDRLPQLCKEYGLEYFHYPVVSGREAVARMMELFPRFCELIDKGDFYIACAMGLHRTDIALCAYWVFYGADKGLEPPALHGYLREKGMRTDKVASMLNAIYCYLTELNGVEPMPANVFKERKAMIFEAAGNSLSLSTLKNSRFPSE